LNIYINDITMDSTVFIIVYNVLCFIADDRGHCSTLKTCVNKYTLFLFMTTAVHEILTSDPRFPNF
jgi:hypothetical protein